MSYFLIRLGEGSKYVKEAQKEVFIVLGWNHVPNLITISSIVGIKKAISYKNMSAGSLATQAL